MQTERDTHIREINRVQRERDALIAERNMLLNVIEDLGMAAQNALQLRPELRLEPAVAKPLKRVHDAMMDAYGTGATLPADERGHGHGLGRCAMCEEDLGQFHVIDLYAVKGGGLRCPSCEGEVRAARGAQ